MLMTELTLPNNFDQKPKKLQMQNPLEHMRATGQHYLDFLMDMHRSLMPDWYLEIGTQTGRSLRHARCNCISIDPEFRIKNEIVGQKKSLLMFQITSDEFFESDSMDRINKEIDLAFLDGMHLYEYLLRDFMNTERYMASDGFIVMHDCLPFEPSMAERDRCKSKSRSWTGDVWKIIPILLKYRPDLEIDLYNAAPTGLAVVRNLDPENSVLRENYEEIRKSFDKDSDVTRWVREFNPIPTERSPWRTAPSGAYDVNLSFSIQIPAPNARVMKKWGDYYFARGLADALQRKGHNTRIRPRSEWHERRGKGEVDIVLRGRAEYQSDPQNLTLYWVISGGGKVPRAELDAAHHIFVAGAPLAKRWSRQLGSGKVSSLLQAFDARAMPEPEKTTNRDGIVFVGISRKRRPIVDLALSAGCEIKLWGNGWRENTHTERYLVNDRIDNDQLGKVYCGSEIVLNDQTRIMERSGLISNRIFDALACGAAVITTPTGGLPELFREYVEEVATPEEFSDAVRRIRAETSEEKDARVAFARRLRHTHSFDARADELVEKVLSLKSAKILSR